MAGRYEKWIGRHWFWAWPAGCMVPILILAAATYLIAAGTASHLKKSHLYAVTVEITTMDNDVKAALGTPVKPHSLRMPRGTLPNEEGKEAKLMVPLKGPKAEGTATITAMREADRWKILSLTVEVDDADGPIVLIAKSEDVAPAAIDNDEQGDSTKKEPALDE